MDDFSRNKVFKQVGAVVDNPDYFIRGEIKKFSGKNSFTNYGTVAAYSSFAICIFWLANPELFFLEFIPLFPALFGAPTRKNTTEIEIVLTIHDKNNRIIGTYIGNSSDKKHVNIYENYKIEINNFTNISFTNAIKQIRNQIINDIEKIEKPQ